MDNNAEMGIVGNPVQAFKLMRRFTVDIPNIEKDLKQDDWKGSCQSTPEFHLMKMIRRHLMSLFLYCGAAGLRH